VVEDSSDEPTTANGRSVVSDTSTTNDLRQTIDPSPTRRNGPSERTRRVIAVAMAVTIVGLAAGVVAVATRDRGSEIATAGSRESATLDTDGTPPTTKAEESTGGGAEGSSPSAAPEGIRSLPLPDHGSVRPLIEAFAVGDDAWVVSDTGVHIRGPEGGTQTIWEDDGSVSEALVDLESGHLWVLGATSLATVSLEDRTVDVVSLPFERSSDAPTFLYDGGDGHVLLTNDDRLAVVAGSAIESLIDLRENTSMGGVAVSEEALWLTDGGEVLRRVDRASGEVERTGGAWWGSVVPFRTGVAVLRFTYEGEGTDAVTDVAFLDVDDQDTLVRLPREVSGASGGCVMDALADRGVVVACDPREDELAVAIVGGDENAGSTPPGSLPVSLLQAQLPGDHWMSAISVYERLGTAAIALTPEDEDDVGLRTVVLDADGSSSAPPEVFTPEGVPPRRDPASDDTWFHAGQIVNVADNTMRVWPTPGT